MLGDHGVIDGTHARGRGVRRRPRSVVPLLPLLSLLWPVAAPSLEGQSVPPHVGYRTFDTPHFTVVYAEGLREVALRSAAHAEEGHRILRETFLPAPRGRIELLVTDHADLANGFAMTSPRPRIVVWARPPMDAAALSHFDDWIGLVSMHELAHVFHLEHAGLPGRALRRVFGRPSRAWPFFPGHLLPTWAIEGSAVHFETVLTGGGRLHGTHHQSTVRAQALDGGVETLDQALGRSPAWPGAARPYVYGSLFFEWLERRYGPGAVGTFLREAGEQWIPYRLDPPARAATGRSLAELWEEWRTEVEADARERMARKVPDGAELLTRQARSALHPAPHPSGTGLAYLRADGRSDGRFVLLEPGGGERTLARWNDQSRAVWTPDGSLLATQPEFVDRWHLRQDVYRIDPGGAVRRLTRGLRVSHVDAHPVDGRIVGVQEVDGTTRLILLSPDGDVRDILREADLAVHWAFPRWSPDGEVVAAVRWRRGGWSSVVLIRPGEAASTERVLVEGRSLYAGPVWSPDGSWLLWASDRDGAFNIYAQRFEEGRPAGSVRQVTRSLSGAIHPAVDPEGRWIYHSRLGGAGWDLARVPFDPDAWFDPAEPDPRFHAPDPEDGRAAEGAGTTAAPRDPPPAPIVREDRPWRATRSLLPGHWLPIHEPPERTGDVEVLPRAFGIETSGHDLVGRHRWSFRSTLPLPGLDPRPEAEARWRWSGLGQPAVVLGASQRLFPMAPVPAPETPGDTLYPLARERSFGVDVELVRQRVRSVAVLSTGVREVRQHRTLREAGGETSERFRFSRPDRTLTELRGSLGVSTLRSYPFSVSPEEGATLTVQGRRRWERALPDSLAGVTGQDGSFDEAIVVGRAFRPVSFPGPVPRFARTALGVRGAVGIARGPGAGPGHFRIGGGGGGGDGLAGFTWGGPNPVFSVRGFPRGVALGDRAWAAGAELRVPLANLHRGRDSLPLHLDRLAAAVFVDAAGAGRPGSGGPEGAAAPGRTWERRGSTGVEVALTHSRLFGDLSRIRTGIAFPLTPVARPGVYVQAGWSF
jgi:hypothetical protein